MAPSHMETEFGSFEYTHKKFNCGYSHKKLGMRLIRRDSQDEMSEDSNSSSQTSMDINNNNATKSQNSSPILFRPYALDEQEEEKCEQIKSQPEFDAFYQFAQSCSQQQSPDAYALKLQRQRAALYMKHIMQYYENGNGWPTMHPNVLQNVMTHNTHSY